MEKRFILAALCTLISCNDGDLQIETIDFNAADIQFCGSATTLSTRLFFKINGDESLILELQNGLLKNEASSGAIISTIPSQSQLTYRIFSGNISKNYFCDNVPPSTPDVLQDVEAVAGEVFVNTVRNAIDSTVFEHHIELSGISLITENGERITDLSINDFGVVNTVQ